MYNYITIALMLFTALVTFCLLGALYKYDSSPKKGLNAFFYIFIIGITIATTAWSVMQQL